MRVFAATSRYLQGVGVLTQLGTYTRELGQRPVAIVDARVQALLGRRLAESYESAGVTLNMLTFPGEVTHAAIDALVEQARACAADVVVGVGGGKALDAAKGTARTLDLRMVSVPTVASNDGPASASIAVYDDQHKMADVLQLKRNPDLVLVDTAVIAAAPLRFFLAGIGDAISKKFEAQACVDANAHTLFGGLPSHAGLAVADSCYRLIREHALGAVAAVKQGLVDENVESVVEATILLSTLSFENGGLSVAHAIARGLPYLPRAAGSLHGEHVAYGLLVQLVLEGRPKAMLDELTGFYLQLGLPDRLACMLQGPPTQDEIRSLAENSLRSPSAARFFRRLDAQALHDAIAEVERCNR